MVRTRESRTEGLSPQPARVWDATTSSGRVRGPCRRVRIECARRASVGVGCEKVGKGEVLAYRVWDFSFFAWRSDVFLGEVFVAEAGSGEDESEGLGLGSVAVTARSSVLIFFNDFVSRPLEARLRVVLIGSASDLSSYLTVADCGSCLLRALGAAAVELRVFFFFFAGRWASSLFAAEARVAVRAMIGLDKFGKGSVLDTNERKTALQERRTRNSCIVLCMYKVKGASTDGYCFECFSNSDDVVHSGVPADHLRGS